SFCCCSAALPVDGITKSTSTLPSSLAAASQPVRAIVQNVAALFETKASFSLLPAAGGVALPSAGLLGASDLLQPETNAARHTAAKRDWIIFIWFNWLMVAGLLLG